jgi:hypothetical protein
MLLRVQLWLCLRGEDHVSERNSCIAADLDLARAKRAVHV